MFKIETKVRGGEVKCVTVHTKKIGIENLMLLLNVRTKISDKVKINLQMYYDRRIH